MGRGGRTSGAPRYAASDRARIADVFIRWALAHPRRGEVLLGDDTGRTWTAEQLAQEVRDGTDMGERQVDALEMVAEHVGLEEFLRRQEDIIAAATATPEQ